MVIRTSETTVTFTHPFQFGDMDMPQPAGTYRVVSDDLAIADVAPGGWHRIASFLRTPAIGAAGRADIYSVSPADLTNAQDADLRRDQADQAREKI